MIRHIKNNQHIGGNEMPKVGKKKFAYTKKGKAAAKRYAKKKKKKSRY